MLDHGETANAPSFAIRSPEERYPVFVTGLGADVFVVQRRVDSFAVDTTNRGPEHRAPEVRPLGSCGHFMRLMGVISCGPLSLVLFEGSRGGHMASDAILEMLV